MKKSMPDVICAAVLLIFLTTVAVQVPAIPKVSRAYPIFLLAVAYLMGIWLLVKSLRRLKHEEKQETEVIAQTKIILPVSETHLDVYKRQTIQSSETLAMRGLDIIEGQLQKNAGCERIHVDHCIDLSLIHIS